ncbi:protein translocase subunit SecD [Cytophagia bacterium CHB2]|nr:protein translocase subunit SecD [Cytophagia bacterium CHB2]
MRRNNTVRTILIAIVVLWAIYQLYPTVVVTSLRGKAETHISALTKLTNIQPDEINQALTKGVLEQRVRQALQGEGAQLPVALQEVAALVKVNDDLAKHESQAIKRGLDLQGGSYLVYEVDLPKMARDMAKNKNAQFDEILLAVETESGKPNVDFFEVLQRRFAEKDLRLNRFFGERSQTDADIIAALKKNAIDAVDRNLEILRNRIDQFGVSEPSITRQGDRRVVIELAGISDVARAKNIIGQTALLEFQLVYDPEVVNEVFTKIDNVVKRDISPQQDSTQLAEAEVDTSAEAKVREEEEVKVEDLFGKSSILGEDSSEAALAGVDSTVAVDKEIFGERPVLSLGAALGPDFGFPVKNQRIVERIINSSEVERVIPADAELAWSGKPEQIADNQYYRLYLLKKEPELTGTYLTEAQATIGSGAGVVRQGDWQVNMNMNDQGARIFSRVTGANVNKRLAIVLDGKVMMAPNIEDRIPNGSAVIRGSMGAQEAQDLAIVLRAGALQVPMKVIEERTVGPSLGKDSIAKGQFSAILGLIIVVVFVSIYYKLSGLIANTALLMNLVIVMAALAFFDATLTLPGVAGIILTIGMAVDANVLIFERIREELRAGKTVRAAIDQGYSRAFWAIFDSNLTTLLTAIVLYQFGTGPIRGFAVTLSIGIVASMFTAIVVTRVIFDFVTSRRRMATLSI